MILSPKSLECLRDMINEKQVDFLMHTKFRVNRIEKTEGRLFNMFYLEEV